MTNFFITDANGKRHTVNELQLQALAAKGKILPTTPLESDTGHQGFAGQIPGLQFNNAAPPPLSQTSQTPPAPSAHHEEPANSSKPTLTWSHFVGIAVCLWLGFRVLTFMLGSGDGGSSPGGVEQNFPVAAQQQENAPVQKGKPVATITAEDLIRGFNTNTVQTDARYKDKRIIVRGIIERVGRDRFSKQPYSINECSLHFLL